MKYIYLNFIFFSYNMIRKKILIYNIDKVDIFPMDSGMVPLILLSDKSLLISIYIYIYKLYKYKYNG